MPQRRVLSLWFPRLAAERVLRLERGGPGGPLAVLCERSNTQVIVCLTPEAEAAGLTRGQTLRDAQALCPGLHTRPA
ncbi:MAG: DNA polymerase Y family protein, partial [Paracoccaceae bacterium]